MTQPQRDQRPNADAQLEHLTGFRPEWVPASGVRATTPGRLFDVVKISGERGVETANTLTEKCDGGAGPILRRVHPADCTLFVVRPRPDTTYRWPPGIRELAADETVQVPAWDFEESTVAWLSHPTPTSPFVDRWMLRDVLVKATGWNPLDAAEQDRHRP